MTLRWHPRFAVACAIVLASVPISPASAQQADCLTCHRALAERKVVHAAVNIGCTACHSELETAAVPHKIKGKLAKGLAGPPPGLCYGCHDSKSFEGKSTHAPAAAGLCLTCHDPHGAERPGLSRQPGATLCLSCHSDVKNTPHVLAGFSGKGHPLGEEPKASAVEDPLRPGRPFYCGSCHEPHRADYARLTRFDAKSMTGFCDKCHKI